MQAASLPQERHLNNDHVDQINTTNASQVTVEAIQNAGIPPFAFQNEHLVVSPPPLDQRPPPKKNDDECLPTPRGKSFTLPEGCVLKKQDSDDEDSCLLHTPMTARGKRPPFDK